MRRTTIARCLNTGLFVALLLPAGASLAQSKATAPRFINSIGDSDWKAAQATTRPWTREEMMSAISLDEPRVNEIKLQQWAEQAAAGQAYYDVKGGPGFVQG